MKRSAICAVASLLLITINTSGIPRPVNIKSTSNAQEPRSGNTSQPETAEAYINDGQRYLQLGMFDKAIDAFKNAVRLTPDQPTPHLGLATAYLQVKRFNDAVESVRKVTAINREDARAHLLLGNIYMEMRRPGDAVSAYKEAVRLDPKSAEAHSGVGSVYVMTGRSEEAIAAFKEALSLNPNLHAAHHNMGMGYLFSGRFDEAITSLKRAMELNPRDAQAAMMIADANNRLGRYTDVVEAYTRLEQISPLQGGTLRNRGFANLYLGRGDAAASDAQAALKMIGWREQSAPFLVLLAHFGYRQAKRDAEARKVIDEAATQLDANAWPYAVLRYLRREITAQSLLAAPMNNDQMTEARAYLGMDLSLAGKKEEALEHLRWVKEYGNRNFVEYPIALTEIKRIESDAPKR